MMRAHLTIAGQPYCTWLGCRAGVDIDAKAGGFLCNQDSLNAAERAAKALRPFFRRGAVRVVRGYCTLWD